MNHKPQDGVTLIEVLVVLAIMAIIAGFAVAQFGNSKANFQRQNVARELKVNLERARFDSVKRRPDDNNDNEKSKVVIESATSFTVSLDFNQDGVVSNAEKRIIDFGYMDGINIVGNNFVFPVTIKFDRRGHITVDGTGSNINPSFIICDRGCTFETANNENSSKVFVSTTGTVTMTGGGESETTSNNPAISNVDPCNNVNNWVTVINESLIPPNCTATTASPTATPTSTLTPTPTPTPTATPANNPTPSPTPAPTQTPTPPTPTPVPTATPNACTSGQKPSQSNCTCYLPMTVRTNGKCI